MSAVAGTQMEMMEKANAIARRKRTKRKLSSGVAERITVQVVDC